MKKKNMMTALVCAVCLAAAPMTVMAEETEGVTEAVTEAAEETTEAGSEAGTEAETEAEVPAVRPEYTASDYVTLGEYKGLSVMVDPITVTDEEVDAETVANLQFYGDAVMDVLTEGTVQEGDTANIDYEGKLDGVAFDGGTAKGFDLGIGSGTFIDGFEEGLVGVAIGDTVDLPLTFPENYTAELAGQDVIFTVTVNEVKRMKEVTDELVNTVTEGEYADLAAYKTYIRSTLEATAEEMRTNTIKNDLLSQISAASTINEFPQELVDYSVDEMVTYYETYAEMYGMEFADFLTSYFGLTEEQFQEQAVMAVEQNLQQEMYLKAVAETEGIEIDEEEFAAGCQKYADDYGFESAEAVVEAIGGEATMRLSLLLDETFEFLIENAVVEEETEAVTEAATEAVTE